MNDYKVEGMEQDQEQKPATHVALTIETAQGISKFFQSYEHLTWEQANPYVLAIAQGVPLTLEEQASDKESPIVN